MSHRLTTALVLVCLLVAGCSGGGSGSPTANTPTATSITITSVGAHVFLGSTETFTATVTLSNGTTQALTGGTWGTDAAAVATVGASTGLVSAVASGEVTVFVDAQSIRGSKRITVVPNYQGIWSGSYSVTSCAQSGDMISVDLCGTYPVGSALPLGFNLNQTGPTVTGQTALGGLVSAPFTGTAATNGSLAFQATVTLGTLLISQAWQLAMLQAGQFSGTVVQTWTDSTLSGQIVVGGTVLTMTRGSAQPQGLPPHIGLRSMSDIRAALGRER